MIAGVRDILANLDEEIVGKFVKRGVYYNYHWADASLKKYKPWQQVEDHVPPLILLYKLFSFPQVDCFCCNINMSWT